MSTAGTSISHSFDSAAATYDTTFTDRRLSRWLRQAVWARLAEAFQSGDRVLELGCGTGEDAVWLARQGIRVTATDASTEMLGVTRRKAVAAGVDGLVEVRRLDLGESRDWRLEIGDWGLGVGEGRGYYDGVLSNFGALNCLADRRRVARALAEVVRPGGRVVVVVMGPVCPWEIVWHLAHAKPGDAFRRFRSGIEAHAGGGATVRVWYPSPRRLRAEFAPWFKPVRAVGIGVLLPPPYLDHLVERRPGLFDRLRRIEGRVAGSFPATVLNDHFLIDFERND